MGLASIAAEPDFHLQLGIGSGAVTCVGMILHQFRGNVITILSGDSMVALPKYSHMNSIECGPCSGKARSGERPRRKKLQRDPYRVR